MARSARTRESTVRNGVAVANSWKRALRNTCKDKSQGSLIAYANKLEFSFLCRVFRSVSFLSPLRISFLSPASFRPLCQRFLLGNVVPKEPTALKELNLLGAVRSFGFRNSRLPEPGICLEKANSVQH